MKTNIIFKNFEGFEHIRNFVEDATEKSLGKFERSKEFIASVICGVRRHTDNNNQSVFDCEVILSPGNNAHKTVVKRSGPNFYTSIKECLRTAERILKLNSKKRVHFRRLNANKSFEKFLFSKKGEV